jgi:nucleotide-binding universal stress UspA family protein
MQTTTTETDATTTTAPGVFQRIFVPVDFTMASHAAVTAALALQQAFGSKVCLFQLVEEGGGADEFLGGLGAPAAPVDLVHRAEGRLRRFAANIAPGYEDKVEVRAYADVKPLESLRYEAHRWDASLVVATAKFQGFFRSPAEKLVHGFDIPVLLIPTTEAEERNVETRPATH